MPHTPSHQPDDLCERLAQLVGTLEIMDDEALMCALRASVEDAERGEVHTSDDVRKMLGL
jgi:hypothetical protein